MKWLNSLLFTLLLSVGFWGCNDKNSNEMRKVHWDRDMCERCKMIVSERHYAVQLINPQDNRAYMFDDIGCAIVWFDEEKFDWFDQAIIKITDGKTGEWIDARTAKYTIGNITPMGYGLSAYDPKNFPNGKTALNFEEATKIVIDAEAAYNLHTNQTHKSESKQ